jgi:acetyl-CoA carboxylase, biotin carboxylase subunit
MFRKVLVANRGEIACRIIRTLREMRIRSVAVFSDVDRTALHVRMADEAVAIGPALAAESYLNIGRILEAARETGADAIHPGYGFLSENAQFARECDRAGLVFIGPSPSSILAMGSKTSARDRMAKAGVPIVPGATCATLEQALAHALFLGYPVMLKASAGGGGKGMRLVQLPADFGPAWERAQSEARNAFGDETLYLEKAIPAPRHVEIQILGDQHGNLVHLFERDCSIQRRHQKVVEESPCPAASKDLVAQMGEIALRGARSVGYFSAGTFEFLLDSDNHFYFLEMNTRLQVEHPITEWITGIDLVRQMVRIAAGERLPWGQEAITRHGAAIECRVYAEDPGNDFLPSPGTIEQLRVPGGPFVRDDSGAYPGCTLSSFYDPLVSKLSVWGPSRAEALDRMRRALSEYAVTGIRTNLSFHDQLLTNPEFCSGTYDTSFIDRHRDQLVGDGPGDPAAPKSFAMAVALAAARLEQEGNHAWKLASASNPSSPLSPWTAAHRARRSLLG